MTEQEREEVEAALVRRIIEWIDAQPVPLSAYLARQIERDFGTPRRKVAGYKDTGSGT